MTSGEKCLTVDPVMSGTSVGHSLHVFTSLTPRVRDRVTALHQVFRRNVSVVSKMQKVENRGKWRKGTVATGHVLKHDSSVFATKNTEVAMRKRDNSTQYLTRVLLRLQV